MNKKQQLLTILMDYELYRLAKRKCNNMLGIGLSPLIKVFLKSFITQQGVGFYIGDEDLCFLFNRWLFRKSFEKGRKGCAPLPGPRLKDLYNLNSRMQK